MAHSPLQNCRDVTVTSGTARRCETIDFEDGIGNISPGGRPLSNPQWDKACPTGGYRAVVKSSPAATPSGRAKAVRKVVAAGDELP